MRTTVADIELGADQTAAIRFLPSGGATGGTIEILRPGGAGVRLTRRLAVRGSHPVPGPAMTVSSSRRQRGFSLLELMVAFVIMAFSLGMLYQASGGTVRSLGDTEQHLRASMLAQSVLNSRDSVPESGWNEAGQSAGLRMAGQQRSFRDWRRGANAPALQQVQIVVAWTDRRGPRQVELTTLLPQAKPAPGGTMSRVRPLADRERMSGFTLVEILVVMTLMSVVMLALGAAMRTIAQTEERVDQRLQRAGRNAGRHQLSVELRWAGSRPASPPRPPRSDRASTCSTVRRAQ